MSQYDDLPTSYQVAHISIKPNIILAPMVGVTDSIFRRMILGLGGCGLVSSEMTTPPASAPGRSSDTISSIFCPKSDRSPCSLAATNRI